MKKGKVDIRTQPIKITTDTTVRVQLTDFGWSVYEEYYSTNRRPDLVKGYLLIRFSTLMNIFGSQLDSFTYDENISVFVENEIVYDLSNTMVNRLAEQVEVEYHRDMKKIHDKWIKRMRSFKPGDKVSKTVGAGKELVYTYVALIPHMGGEAHEIVGEDGRMYIVDFFELEYAS